MMKKLSAVLLMCAAVLSCSIVEYRDDCPCILQLDFGEIDKNISDSLSFSISADGFSHTDVVQSESYGQDYYVDVPRNTVSFVAYSNIGEYEMMMTGDSLLIPCGEECPEVYMTSCCIDTGHEFRYERIGLYKNYCRLTVRIIGYGVNPFDLLLEGRVCGYGKEGKPLEGEFAAGAVLNSAGECSVNIPRQTDASLRLILSDEDGRLREFAIGEYLVESAYDWNALDLEDVRVEIDYSLTRLTLVINEVERIIDIEVLV